MSGEPPANGALPAASERVANGVPPEGQPDRWAALREFTPARIGLARAGDALTTRDQLELRLAHARARDAVHAELDLAALRGGLAASGPVVTVTSAAGDRATYLQRPDLGRQLSDGAAEQLPAVGADLALVLADGLSPLAVQSHAPAMVDAITARLAGWSIAPIVVATQARVAIGDPIGAALGARFVAVLIGERPGLSAADSLGIYLTRDPQPGRLDAERNCISNIRPPVGLSYAAAADTLVALLHEADRIGVTGVALKDQSTALEA